LLTEVLTLYFKEGSFGICFYSMKEIGHNLPEWVATALILLQTLRGQVWTYWGDEAVYWHILELSSWRLRNISCFLLYCSY